MFTFSILLSQSVSPSTGQLTGLVILSILTVFSKTIFRRNHPVCGPSRLTQSEGYKESHCLIAQFHQNIAKPKPFTDQLTGLVLQRFIKIRCFMKCLNPNFQVLKILFSINRFSCDPFRVISPFKILSGLLINSIFQVIMFKKNT